MPTHRIRPRGLCGAVAVSLLMAACSGGGGGGSGGTGPNNGAPPTNVLSGTVTFQGAPLAGATVVAYHTNDNTVFASTTTDANGDYSIAGLDTGCFCQENYQLFATKPGYAFLPVLAADPSGSHVGYQFDPAPHNWFVSNGSAVTRAGYNGAFSNANGGAGIMFNVINFMSVANNSTSGADFHAYDGSNPLAGLPATGQQTSYAAGDDASVQQGVAWPAQRYLDNQDGSITDQLTGLVWLKDASCLNPTTWANAVAAAQQLASGSCGLSDGSSAGQWRLPNIVELESLVDASASNPAVTAGSPFSNVSSAIYWSSTVYYGGQQGSSNAWAIRFSDGRFINDGVNNAMATSSNAVWAVKGAGGAALKLQASGAYVPFASGDDGSVQSGAPLPAPRLRDNADGTFTDTATGLIWLKQADCIQQAWAAAVAAVKALGSGQCGLSDGSGAGQWRMPNRKEMLSLADRAQNNQADYFDETFVSGTAHIATQAAAFSNFGFNQYYWTSTTDAADTSEAWTVFSCDFGVYDTPKTSVGYTLAVR